MPTPTIPAGNLYMNATTYTGNGSSSGQAITNGGTGTSFQPDFVWIKSRSQAYNHYDVDSVRGFSGSAARVLQPNLTTAEETDAANSGGAFKSFNSNGFTVAQPASGWAGTNENGTTYVGWQWKAGGAAVTNTAGSITSSVSANTTSGFSVVTATMALSGAQTVGHGLGAAPALIISKDRTQANDWYTYHSALGNSAYMKLNTAGVAVTSSPYWNNTSPTSSVFSLGSVFAGVADNLVFYCWAPIAGYSAFGSYTGNGSADGPFIYTGFRPKLVMFKAVSGSAYNWDIMDTSRSPYNASNLALNQNLSAAESSPTTIDFLSNGIKIRQSNSGNNNDNGSQYIYAAFAENPFKYSNAR